MTGTQQPLRPGDRRRTRVLLISHDVVGERMAGPGIRYSQLARVLARDSDVTLAAPGDGPAAPDGFQVCSYRPGDWPSLRGAVAAADMVVCPGIVLQQCSELCASGLPIVVDWYDPYPAESMSLVHSQTDREQAIWHRYFMDQLRLESARGDFFLCASEQQRAWWLGILASHGRINASTYQDDPSLRRLIDVAPFGLSPAPLVKRRPVLRGVVPGIGADDKVLLWGGGIWEWLDPLTLIRGLAQALSQRRDIKLVFPGTRHPSPSVPDMPMRQRTVALATEMGLLDTHVFFGDWVAQEDWPDYLMEADIGVSLHKDTLETRLAFRSRILDYIRAGLPMLVTRGDATSELVAAYKLGLTVDYECAEDVARAMLTLLDEPKGARRQQFSAAQSDLTWERSARPLVQFSLHPRRAADHGNVSAPAEIANTRAAEEKSVGLIQSALRRWSTSSARSPIGEPPNSSSAEDLRALVRSFPYWYQRIYLGKGIYSLDQPAYHEGVWDRVRPTFPTDLGGASVLDVGTNAGFFALEAKRRGAGRVVGIESVEDYRRQAEACRSIWGLDIEYLALDAHQLDKVSGQFEIVIFTGILYHLKNPLYVLEEVGRLCQDAIVVETEVIPENPKNCVNVRQGPTGKTRVTPCRTGIMKFIERDELNGDGSNWWVPDTECVMGMLRTAGFTQFSAPCYLAEGRLLLIASKQRESLLDLRALK